MTEAVERRAVLAMGGTAGVALTGLLSPVEARGKYAASAGKQVVAIPTDNPVFGPDQSAYETYGYSPAVRAGGLLFIAGQVGIRPDRSIPQSVAEQGELALRRTAEILRLEGLSFADLVEVVSYHVDIADNLPDFLPLKARYMQRPFPAWSIIGVEALAVPALRIEIRSIAALRG